MSDMDQGSPQHVDATVPSGQDEFADHEGPGLSLLERVHWSRLLTPTALRGLAALAAGIYFLFSGRSARDLATLIAIVVIVWGVADLAFGDRGRRWLTRFVSPLVLVGVGVALLVWPDVTSRVLALVIGALTALAGIRDVGRAFRSDESNSPTRWLVLRGVFTLVLGGAILLAPSVIFGVAIAFFGLFWVITGVAVTVANLSSPSAPFEVTDVWGYIFEWLDQRPETADDRHQLYAKLFYEGPLAARRLSRFVTLMGFATAIAAFGIVSDSTAVVIGAMLVAPLMTPLMGTALSLVMGWRKRVAISGSVALIGIALAIGLSAVFGAMLAAPVDPISNSQVTSRIAPTLIDLMIAIAAGGAGAFALSRPDVSDALPGVAVAIALVPPLAVVGLMVQQGAFDAALGALLLFVTNMLAILMVGAIVFLLTGVVPIRRLISQGEWVRNTSTLLGMLAVVVVAVLGTTGDQLTAQVFERSAVESVVIDWVGEAELTVFDITVGSDDVEVVLVGPDHPGPVEELGGELRRELGRDVTVVVRLVPEQRFEVDTRDLP